MKDLEIELAIRHLQTEKSVFPENGRAEVTKAVFDSMKKRAQDCVQLGGHHLENFVFKK